MVVEATICHVLDGDRILLKKASRGVSKGKWNAPGGKVDEEETPEQNAIREVFEETGLKISKLFHHGEMDFYLDGKNEVAIHSHLFSTKTFLGNLRSTEEGEVRWFDRKDIPFKEMWPDDIYWMDLMLQGKKFDASFHFNNDNSAIVKHFIRVDE